MCWSCGTSWTAWAARRPADVKGRPAVVLSQDEQDVVSALVNLGCQRPAAEAAVKKAMGQVDGPGFEPLFRRAMELLR